MGIWMLMFITVLLIPAMMIIFGLVFLKRPPKKINNAYGYRTKMSMKNKDTWEFAHQYVGKVFLRFGCILLPISAAAMVPLLGKNEDTVSIVGSIFCILQCVPLFTTIFLTEKALKKAFDKDGNRK